MIIKLRRNFFKSVTHFIHCLPLETYLYQVFVLSDKHDGRRGHRVIDAYSKPKEDIEAEDAEMLLWKLL